MELENCNTHGDHENMGPNTPQNENDPSGNKKWYRQASQRLVNAVLAQLAYSVIIPATRLSALEVYTCSFPIFDTLIGK
jgi:hypothetical protein